MLSRIIRKGLERLTVDRYRDFIRNEHNRKPVYLQINHKDNSPEKIIDHHPYEKNLLQPNTENPNLKIDWTQIENNIIPENNIRHNDKFWEDFKNCVFTKIWENLSYLISTKYRNDIRNWYYVDRYVNFRNFISTESLNIIRNEPIMRNKHNRNSSNYYKKLKEDKLPTNRSKKNNNNPKHALKICLLIFLFYAIISEVRRRKHKYEFIISLGEKKEGITKEMIYKKFANGSKDYTIPYPNDEGNRKNEAIETILLLGKIETTNDDKNYIITNKTTKNHLLHPGSVNFHFYEENNSVFVKVTGEGNGRLARSNEILGEIVFRFLIEKTKYTS